MKEETAVAVNQGQGIAVRMQDLSPAYAEIMVLGNVLQRSGYFKDVRDQAQAVTKILYGRELGFSPIVSMSGIHIIEGKPALSSNLLATMIKRSGKYDYRVKTWTDTECVLTFREKVADKWEDVGESSFTIEDARRAGVVRDGGGWKKYPKAMLFARALSQGERTYCPDVSSCALYVPEELGATVNESGDVTELPKSASNVPRTTEPIEIDGPAKGGGSSREIPLAKGEEPKTVEKLATPAEVEALTDALQRQKGETPPEHQPGDDDEDEEGLFIDLAHQRAIHRAAKDAAPAHMVPKDKDLYFRAWLCGHGYKDEKGEGTTKAIPAVRFDEVKAAAVKYMESL
jgi:hypothetical protein